MRLLANESVPYAAVTALRAEGHDVLWVRTEMPGASDHEVLDRAQRDGRLVVTFDKDFGELAFRDRRPASEGIVLFRITTPSPESVARTMMAVLSARTDWDGHFSVVDDDSVRMTPLPQREP